MTDEDTNSKLKRIRLWLRGVESASPQLTDSVAQGKDNSKMSCGESSEGLSCKLCLKLNEADSSVPLKLYNTRDTMLKHAESHAGPLKLSVITVMKCCFEDDTTADTSKSEANGRTDLLECAILDLLEKYKEEDTIECSYCDEHIPLEDSDIRAHVYSHWDIDKPLLRCGLCGLCDNDLNEHVINQHPDMEVTFIDYKDSDPKLQKELATLLWSCFSPKLTLPSRVRKPELSSVERLRASATKIASKTRTLLKKQQRNDMKQLSDANEEGKDKDQGDKEEPIIDKDDVRNDAILGAGCIDDDVRELVEDLVPKLRSHIEMFMNKCEQDNNKASCALCEFAIETSETWTNLYTHMWTHCKLPLYACQHCDFNGIKIEQHCKSKHPRKTALFNCHIPDHVESIMQLVRLCFTEKRQSPSPTAKTKTNTPSRKSTNKLVAQPVEVVGDLSKGRPAATLFLKPLYDTLVKESMDIKNRIVCGKCGYKPVSATKNKQKIRYDRLESHVHYHMDLKPFSCTICDWTGTTVVDHFAKKHARSKLSYMDTREAQKDVMQQIFVECFFDGKYPKSSLAKKGKGKRSTDVVAPSSSGKKRKRNEPVPDVAVTEDDYEEMDEFLVDPPPILEAVNVKQSEPSPEPVLLKMPVPKHRPATLLQFSTLSPALVRPGQCDFLRLLYDRAVEEHADSMHWRCANCNSKLMFFQGGNKPSYSQIENHLLHHTRLPAYCCDICRLYRGNDILGHFKSVHPERPLSYRDLRYDFKAELTASFYQCFSVYLDRR